MSFGARETVTWGASDGGFAARDLLQFGLPSLPNSTDLVGQFTDFGLSFAGGIAVGLIIAIAAMALGFVLAFFGSRLFKYTLFAIAFVFGAALGFFIVLKIGGSSESGIIVAAVLGLILGAVAVKVWKLSLFLLGAACGFVIWSVFKALFPGVLTTPALLYGVLAGVCLVLGLIAIKMEKIWLLLGTPILGTFLFIQGVNYFLPTAQQLDVFQILDTSEDAGSCTFATCYVLYSAVIGGSLLGFFVQYRYTSEYGKKRREKAAIKAEAKQEHEERDKHRRKYRKRHSDEESDEDD